MNKQYLIEEEEINYKSAEPNIQHAHEVWQDWELAKDYQASVGISSKIPTFVKFYEGDQWPQPTEKTKNLPRPVFNELKRNVDFKVSNILGTPIKLNYIGENQEDTSKFSRFASWQLKDMNIGKLNKRACRDGAIKGTYIYHIYYDDKAKGRKGRYEGAVRAQIIDPLNICFSNPTEHDEQKQKWIIIVYRAEVGALREIADEDVDKDLIVPDDIESNYNEVEQDSRRKSEKQCTVLLRYFRKDGEVYFEKVVKQTIVHKPRPLNPLTSEKILSLKEKSDNAHLTNSPDEDLEREVNDYKAWLYPVVVGSWEERDNSIYGIGEIENNIPNQKAINFEIAMQLLNHQELGWGKILVKQNALGDQEIDNTPGQLIIDHTPGNQWGITRMEGSQLTSSGSNLVNVIIDLMRNCTNSSEVITGEMISKDLSGTAIAQLQAQSQKPIVSLQKAFWESQERLGKVLEQFYKLFYEDVEFTYDLKPDEVQERENELRAMGVLQEVGKTQFDKFNGSEYLDKNFAIVCEAGAGTQYSEIMSIDVLNNLFLNGSIKNMSSEQVEQYMTLMPDSAMPFKSELKAIIRKQQASELSQYKQATEQLSQQVESDKVYISQLEETVKQLKEQVDTNQKLLEEQSTSYKQKAKDSNILIGQMFQQLRELQNSTNKAKNSNNTESNNTNTTTTDNETTNTTTNETSGLDS